eukprot:scaffold172956_cov31-Tisochrysis_lutea.AAC.5
MRDLIKSRSSTSCTRGRRAGSLISSSKVSSRDCREKSSGSGGGSEPQIRMTSAGMTRAVNGVWRANSSRQVERRADTCVGHRHSAVEHLRDAKVAEADEVHPRQEDVLWLKVAVQHFAVVRMLEGEADLHEPVEDLRLCKRRLARCLSLDPLREVSAVGEVHHYVQDISLLEVLVHSNHVRVAAQLHHHSALIGRVLSLLLRHVLKAELLHHVQPRVGVRADEVSGAKSTATDHPLRLVLERAPARRRSHWGRARATNPRTLRPPARGPLPFPPNLPSSIFILRYTGRTPETKTKTSERLAPPPARRPCFTLHIRH